MTVGVPCSKAFSANNKLLCSTGWYNTAVAARPRFFIYMRSGGVTALGVHSSARSSSVGAAPSSEGGTGVRCVAPAALPCGSSRGERASIGGSSASSAGGAADRSPRTCASSSSPSSRTTALTGSAVNAAGAGECNAASAACKGDARLSGGRRRSGERLGSRALAVAACGSDL